MILELTQAVDGTKLLVNADEIEDVREYPAGQCWIDMKNGVSYQPAESVEHVTKLWNDSQK